jgi:Peptidase family S58
MLNRDNLAAFLRTRLADESPPPVAGSTQVQELGVIETPIALTNTLSVGAAFAGLVRHALAARVPDRNLRGARQRRIRHRIFRRPADCACSGRSSARCHAARGRPADQLRRLIDRAARVSREPRP